MVSIDDLENFLFETELGLNFFRIYEEMLW